MNRICLFFSQSLIGLGILSATTVFLPNSASAETKTAEFGKVRAEISYQQPEEYQYKNVRLKIVRAGQTVLDQALPRENDYDRPAVALGGENALPVADLDGDKEPEVITNLFTGGAHCCTYSLIYRYDAAQKRYTSIRQEWGNVGYRLKDLNKDGLPEFESADDRFAAAFSSYAASGYPLQIWQYRQGKLTNVTRNYLQLIYSNASQLWQSYTRAKNEGYGDETKGLLAAYLAEKYQLGQGQEGWRLVQQAYKGKDRVQYFANLRRFLRETGYLR